MSYKKRALVALPVLLLLCLTIWFVYEYRKPHTGAGDKTTAVFIRADNLFRDFSQDETAANAKYLDKIIEVTGTVDHTETANGATLILLNANQLLGGISCKMFDNKNDAVQKGQAITIKGKCSGFLSDVNLVDCVLKK